MNRSIIRAALLAASVVAVASPAHSSTLVNGSFEQSNGGYAQSLSAGATNIAGWTISGSSDLAWLPNGNPYAVSAFDGAYHVDLWGFGDNTAMTVSQMVATVVGQTYQLNFAMGSHPNDTGPIGIKVTAGTAGSQIFSRTVPGLAWTEHSWSFVANSDTTLLSFAGNQGRYHVGLDAVSLTGGVPEPATWAMMIGGFGMVGGAMRRTRKRQTAPAAA